MRTLETFVSIPEVLRGQLSHPQGTLFFCSIGSRALDLGMIFPTPRPVTFVGINARGSGTGNPLIKVVTSTVFDLFRGT